MTARELDAEIAKILYGKLVVTLPNGDFSLGPADFYDDPDTGERKLHNPVPYYTTNIDLLEDVLRKLMVLPSRS